MRDRVARSQGAAAAPAGEAAPASPSLTSGTVGEVVAELTASLRDAGIPAARQESRDLLAAMLGVPRLWPTANAGAPVDAATLARARAAARRRRGGAPFAYAVGRAAFRHLTLVVDEGVLIPRQETEVLVDELLAALGPRTGGTVVDVGTGSGAIALALAAEAGHRLDRVIAIDVSLDALAVARANAERLAAAGALRCPVELYAGALLAPLATCRPGSLRAVVSNPPYIAFEERDALPASVRDWEPALALYSSAGGLAHTAMLVGEAAPLLEAGGVLALEADCRRASLVAELLARHGAYRDIAVRLDLAGRERFVLARRAGAPHSSA